MFTLLFLNNRIEQNTNFAKLPSVKWLFWHKFKNCSLQVNAVSTPVPDQTNK